MPAIAPLRHDGPLLKSAISPAAVGLKKSEALEPVRRVWLRVSEHRRYAVHHRDQGLEVEPNWNQVLPTAGVNAASGKGPQEFENFVEPPPSAW